MRRIAVLAAAAAFAFAGCGGDDEPESAATSTETPAEATEAPTEAATEAPTEAAGGATLAIAADPGGALKFTETEYTATAGEVTVEFANDSQVPHAAEIEGNGVEEETETVTGQDAPPLKVDLPAGEYTIYCPVGNHRQAGMEAKLTVR
jgi:plastocyanin